MLAQMNPLFLGLLVAGALVVVGVLIYNWLQERRARRRLEAAFRKTADSSVGAAGSSRVEPMLRSGDDVETASQQSVAIDTGETSEQELERLSLPDELADLSIEMPLSDPRADRSAVAPDPDIECVVALQLPRPLATATFASALMIRHAKPVRWLGRRGVGLPWQAIDAALPGPWHELAACLLLADRAGAARRADIETFLRTVDAIARDLSAGTALPDAAGEAERAEALDRYCADLDVQIGLTILKAEVGQIAGTRLRGVAEAAGFRLNATGYFDYLQEETGAVLFSLQNYKQEPFTPESLRVLTTPGVVLLLDVPRVADPVKVLDQMRLLAKRLTQTLEGVLVDDNRRPLTDAALAAIRGQVQATAAALRESHIDPGGSRALRLFG